MLNLALQNDNKSFGGNLSSCAAYGWQYFCGYTTKRQLIGKYEFDQSSAAINLLAEKLRNDLARRQLASVANRMLTDLQCRGMLRTAREEVNQAAHAHEHHETNAEFIRTF